MDKHERAKWLEGLATVLQEEGNQAAAMGVLVIAGAMREGPAAEGELMEALSRFIRERQRLAGRLN